MTRWTCATCHWTIEFPSGCKHPKRCPLCAARGQSAAVERDPQGAQPHRWVSQKEARARIVAGQPLRHVYVESIDVDGETLDHPVEIVESVVGACSARETTFGREVDLSDTRVLGRFDTGAGDSERLGRFARGARFGGWLRLTRTRFYKGAGFEGCQMEAGLEAAYVQVWGQLDLSGAEIRGVVTDFRDARLDLLMMRDTRFQSDLVIERATVRREALVSGIVVEGLALASEARFEGEFYLGGSRFVREANFSNALFLGSATFDASEFRAELDLERTHFKSEAEFHGLDFCGWADVEWSHFEGPVVMEGMRIAKGASFDDSIFRGTLTLLNIDSMGETHFRRVSFHEIDISCSEFWGRVDLRDARVEGDLRLDRAVFSRGLFLARSQFGGPVRGESVVVGDALKGSQVVAEDSMTWRECTFEGHLLLAGGHFEKAFELPGTAIAGCLDLQQAEFGALADLKGCQFELIRLANISVQTEAFQVELRQIRGHLQSEQDRDYATAAREWEFLHHSFEDQNRGLDSDRAYHKMRQMGNRGDRKGLKKIWRILEVIFIDWGTGYGTRPVNIILFSLFTILALAFLYVLVPAIALSGSGTQNTSVMQVLLLSFNSFLAWEGASIVLALEAFVGGFLVALFTAILSRRMFRS